MEMAKKKDAKAKETSQTAEVNLFKEGRITHRNF